MTNPTKTNYDGFNKAYDFFNRRLFSNELPRCLITMQRGKTYYGFFAGGTWKAAEGGEEADEIALNPSTFRSRTTEETLSTLVHEMAHLWQFHHGKPSRNGYHNKEWGRKMREIGLVPSSTGKEGGKETGQKVSHYIDGIGRFKKECAALIEKGFQVPYIDFLVDEKKKKKKAASKTKYTCPECDLNAWAKPDVLILCGEYDAQLEAEEAA